MDMATASEARAREAQARAAAEALRLQRQREEEAARGRRLEEAARQREYQARLNAELTRRQEERQARERDRQRQHERQMEAQRRRQEAARQRQHAGGGYSQFTPPQAFISGNAASHIAGAPTLFDVALTLGSAAGSTVWVATRDHSTGGDIGWAAFFGFLGAVLMVEGHAEAHDIGVGMAPAAVAYLAARLIGGTTQPTTL